MTVPELTIVAGPNAAGKSSFIRTRINELEGCEVIMTDIYKGRTIAIVKRALQLRKDIILETVFNDAAYKDIVEEARNAGYHTSLIVLFLDTIEQSVRRVAFRSLEQNGLQISSGNIRINFNESFKNIASYYFYFHQADFVYTGVANKNQLLMRFKKMQLVSYQSTHLQYPQKFADFAKHDARINDEDYWRIKENKDFNLPPQPESRIRKRLNI